MFKRVNIYLPSFTLRGDNMSKTGFTTKELLDMDISEIKQFNDKDLKNAVRTLADASAKRYKRAKEAGEFSQAGYILDKYYNGQITTKVNSRKELEKELQKGYYFMQSKSSTHKGRKEIKEEFEKRIEQELSEEEERELWDIINKLDELYESGNLPVYGALGSNTVQKKVAEDIASGKSADDILKNANDRLNKAYIIDTKNT